jgi:hypothetical protein
LDSCPPLHFSPFWIKLFLGICQWNSPVSSALNYIWWCVFIYYLVQFWFPVFNHWQDCCCWVTR